MVPPFSIESQGSEQMCSGSGGHQETGSELHILGKKWNLWKARIKECPGCKKVGTSIWILYQQVLDALAVESGISTGCAMGLARPWSREAHVWAQIWVSEDGWLAGTRQHAAMRTVQCQWWASRGACVQSVSSPPLKARVVGHRTSGPESVGCSKAHKPWESLIFFGL